MRLIGDSRRHFEVGAAVERGSEEGSRGGDCSVEKSPGERARSILGFGFFFRT